jgi:Flp pilus assembly protein TadD
MRYSLAFLLAFFAAGGFALPALGLPQGVSETAAIVGYVRDSASREPIMGARIEISSPNGLAVAPHFSTTNGEFHINAGDGDYSLTILRDGYQTAHLSVSVVAGHQTRLDVDLVKTTSDSAPASAEAVSAHQLTVPAKARGDYDKAMARMAKRDFPGAITLFQKAIDEYPGYYEAYAEMGVTEFMLGQVQPARDSLQKSIDLSSGKYSNAFFDLAGVLNSARDFAGAEPMARKGIALEDGSWRGHFELARALTGLKRFPEAEQSADKSRSLNAQNPQLFVVLTNIHLGTKDYAAAVKDIDAYLQLDPSSAASNQMRQTRDQLSAILAANPAPPQTPSAQKPDQPQRQPPPTQPQQ